jgi:hypothetical protein
MENEIQQGESQQPDPMMEKPPKPWAAINVPNLEDHNLVPLLEADKDGKEWLEKRAKKQVDEYESDVQSAKGYYENLEIATQLYLGKCSLFEDGPAEGERKPCLPILAKIVNRIYARVVGMILKTEPIAVPTGDEDNERAIRISQHIAWEKRSKHPDWAPSMSASALQWVLYGSMFRYTGWDPLENKKAIEWISSTDFVMPYTDNDPDPRLSNVERATRVSRLPKWKIKRLGKAGHFHGVDKMFGKNAEKKPTPAPPKSDPLSKAIIEFQGVEPQTDKKGTSYEFLTRYSWEELPGDEEHGPRRLAMTLEKSTKRVVRIVIMEEEDKLDRVRYDNEVRLKGFEAQRMGMDPAMAMTEIAPVATRPVYPIIHYKFHPNPEGIYGLGVWAFTSNLNELANELAGEDIVGQRIANVSGSTGFMSNDLQEDNKGEVKLKYGMFTGVNASGDQLQSSIMPLNFERPKGNILGWIDKVDQEAQAVMSSSDYQSGLPGPSHETAAAAKLRVSEGMNNITAALEAFLVPLTLEYKNYARLNALYMSEEEFFMVVEPNPENPTSSKPRMVKIGRNDYEADYDITFSADARFEVDPGIGASAIQAYQMIMADPDLAGEQNLKMAARKKALRALKSPELAMMLPDEVPPPPPPTPQPQESENAGFMNEKDSPVLDDDDDIDHLAKMDEFEVTGLYNELSSTGKQLHDRHKRGHKANAYKKGTMLLRPETAQPMNGPTEQPPLPPSPAPGPADA